MYLASAKTCNKLVLRSEFSFVDGVLKDKVKLLPFGTWQVFCSTFEGNDIFTNKIILRRIWSEFNRSPSGLVIENCLSWSELS